MATAGVPLWSTTAASNSSADPAVNFAEGQAPSSVNDSARALMASVAKWRNDTAGTLTTGGSSTAFTLATASTFATEAAMDGTRLTVKFNATSGAAPTLAVDGLTARAIQTASGTAVPTGFFLSGSIYTLTFVNSIPAWLVHGTPAVLPAGTALPSNSVVTASITDANVTNAKLADMATSTLKGRATAGTGVPEDLTIGTGLSLSGTTISAPAFPPTASFKNLVIKVASNTTVTVTADFVTTTDGTNYKTTAVSSTVNFATTGADALDTGSIAAATWYALHVVVKADGTTKVVGSTSATSPTMPADYTYKARVGWVRTAAGSAQFLGTWQFNRRAQYILGLAQTSILPLMINGAVGTYHATTPTYTSQSISAFVPTTASEIDIQWTNDYDGAARSMIGAPSNSYAGPGSTKPPPIHALSSAIASGRVSWTLESSNIYFAATGDGGALLAAGWTDNI